MSQQPSHTKHLPSGPGAADPPLTFTSNTSPSHPPQPPPPRTWHGWHTIRSVFRSVCVCSVCGVTRWPRPWRLEPGTVNVHLSATVWREFFRWIQPTSHYVYKHVFGLQGGWKVHALWKDTGGRPGYERSLQLSSHLTYSFSCRVGKAPREEECRTARQVIRAEGCWETNKSDTKRPNSKELGHNKHQNAFKKDSKLFPFCSLSN